ncbi:hypothetical protein SISNIDRAFT_488219 [Sistotremastrum niveocremeum HHB9708]|uniref:EF-hand domain-containing protein n=1 Tax=Sistotremastrum niveocremeum HHB9708 TaxID=1314777 RepID=A0A164RKL6_9AGAM|nr:hypothetical protein SISNIDRAFT_488219 [Sistotremastrum niveocremeum HHB9708]
MLTARSISLPSILLAASLAVTMLTSGAQAECCDNSQALCADCTQTTPCCGYGKCNIFCCNCDGGCRKGFDDGLHPHVLDVTGHLDDNTKCIGFFREQDSNRDGHLSLTEWVTHAYANTKSKANKFVRHASPDDIEKFWRKFDVDGKGYITLDEALTKA